MLIRFELENFRSVHETAGLSMVAIDSHAGARSVDGLPEELLTTAAIYGPNASGKSNIIAGLAWLADALRNSLRTWEDKIPVDGFAFGPSGPSTFRVEAIVKGVRYEYELSVTQREIQYEALHAYPEKRRRLIFEREGLHIHQPKGAPTLAGAHDLLTPTTLVASIARRFDDRSVQDFVRYLALTQTRGISLHRRFRSAMSTIATERWLDEPIQPTLDLDELDANVDRERALSLLKMADLGIEDVQFEDDPRRPARFGDIVSRRQIQLLHRTAGKLAPLPFAEESVGTQAWFALIGPILNSLREGSLLLFDELDSSLHPTLTAELVELFQNPVSNPAGAQLIFTTHDTSLLNHLNRDEVWLTEKSEHGASRLYALADYSGERVRKSVNLERGYLRGRFGSLPEIDKSLVLKAIGLGNPSA